MKFSEVLRKSTDVDRIEDCKGNYIISCEAKNLGHWDVDTYSKDGRGNATVKIIAPQKVAKAFYADLLGARKAKDLPCLLTEREISDELGISPYIARAFLWSCATYGLTQREKPFDSDRYYWVVE